MTFTISKPDQIFKTEDELQQAISDYYMGKSFSDLARELNCSNSGIRGALKKAGIVSRGQYGIDGKQYNQKYTLKEDVFENIDTAEKAYWLGFLYADGNVSSREFVISLSQSSPREYILSDFQKFLETDYPVSLMQRGKLQVFPNDKEYYQKDAYRLIVRSEKMKRDLINLGCFPNKTFDLKFPTERQVPKEFQMSFIHGYFDGDGSVVPNKNTLAIRFMGTEDLMKAFRNVLFDIFKKIPKLTEDNRTNGIFYLPYSNVEGMIELYSKFYDGITPYIKDKKEKFDNYFRYRQGILQERKSKLDKRTNTITTLLSQGMSQREIQRQYGYNRTMLKNIVDETPSIKVSIQKNQEIQKERIFNLYNQGISQRKISKILNISRSKLSEIISELIYEKN